MRRIGERLRERKRVGGEESKNRSLMSLLLYFTVALLPAGDIQASPNAHEQTKHMYTQTALLNILK